MKKRPFFPPLNDLLNARKKSPVAQDENVVVEISVDQIVEKTTDVVTVSKPTRSSD